MSRYQALLTETDRKHITGESNPSQEQEAQAVYRVRQRINHELPTDIDILTEYRPDVWEELRYAVVEQSQLATGVEGYVAVKDHQETGHDEILFDGEPIKHFAHHGGDDGLSWGYRGGGSMNTAKSILKHAADRLEMPYDPGWHDGFVSEFIARQTGSRWVLPLDTVELWIRENTSDSTE